MTVSRRVLLVACLGASLAACVTVRVDGAFKKSGLLPVSRLVVIMRDGHFGSAGAEALWARKSVTELIPVVHTVLPMVFSSSGVPTWAGLAPQTDAPRETSLSPDEGVLIIVPEAASYSNRSGRAPILRAELRQFGATRPVWRARIEMTTSGFGGFDEKVVTDLSGRLLEQLRSDEVVKRSADAIKTQ